MLISLDKKLTILAMTKTGSTAVAAALASKCDIVFQGAPRIKHMQLRRYERFLVPYLSNLGADDIETTCVFRDPIGWLGSWYRYRSRPALNGAANSTAQMSFVDFVKAYLLEDRPAFARVGQPSKFVRHADGSVGVDHLFRYDNFDGFQRFLEDRFETKLNLERINVSAERNLDLPPALERRLREALADDYEIYESIASV